MRKKLLIATNNLGKIKEIKALLKDIPLDIVAIWDIEEIPNDVKIKETGKTFAENAELKAITLGKMAGILALAEDSGLEVDALGGKPGVKSSRFAKGDQDRIAKLLRLLKGIPLSKRTARFKTAVAIYDPRTGKTKIFEGITKGIITARPFGTGGFGYDPIFYSEKLKKTFGQASLEEKNRVSHRARALRKAKIFLLKYPAKLK
jgi:XTP/dITP diphosphohydrolase